jgi:hypothetical protein
VPVLGRARARPLPALKATGGASSSTARRPSRGSRSTWTGVDYLVAHSYKWLLSPRGPVLLLRAAPAARGDHAVARRLEVALGPVRGLLRRARAGRRRTQARCLHPLVLGREAPARASS